MKASVSENLQKKVLTADSRGKEDPANIQLTFLAPLYSHCKQSMCWQCLLWCANGALGPHLKGDTMKKQSAG